MTKNQEKIVGWIYGMASGIGNGLATTILAMQVAPSEFNFSPEKLSHILAMMGWSTVMSAALYMKQSPLPRLEFGEAAKQDQPPPQP